MVFYCIPQQLRAFVARLDRAVVLVMQFDCDVLGYVDGGRSLLGESMKGEMIEDRSNITRPGIHLQSCDHVSSGKIYV